MTGGKDGNDAMTGKDGAAATGKVESRGLLLAHGVLAAQRGNR